MLERDIWVVTSNKARTERGNLIEKMPSGHEGEPMLLGHLGEWHYWSLGKFLFSSCVVFHSGAPHFIVTITCNVSLCFILYRIC